MPLSVLSKPGRFTAALLLFTVTAPLTACGDSEEKKAFIGKCEAAIGADRTKICACTYDGLEEKNFSKEQIARIPELFKMDLNQIGKFLKGSPFADDADILKRLNSLEETTESCAKKYK